MVHEYCVIERVDLLIGVVAMYGFYLVKILVEGGNRYLVGCSRGCNISIHETQFSIFIIIQCIKKYVFFNNLNTIALKKSLQAGANVFYIHFIERLKREYCFSNNDRQNN